jgi:hypothetical protein
MDLLTAFRWLLPLHNTTGFGPSDFVEFGFALLLVALLLTRARLEPALRRLAGHTGWCMLALGVLVVVLRLALLPLHPVPTPTGADDFSYLLSADTLVHLRLANPTHPLHQFFETTFVLQQPSYSSIYPLGQGIFLAIGQAATGSPWAGVLLSSALFCALCFWMLRGWLPPLWALAGGLLAICEFGPLCSWMNCYWGGAVSGLAGCLVFGALPRLREREKTRDAVLLGLGIGLQMLARPFESVFLDLGVVLFFAPELRRPAEWPRLARITLAAGLALLPPAALLLAHNHAVTNSWTTLPYALSRYQYGVPTTLTFQPIPAAHAQLTAAQRLYYEGQSAVHGPADTVAGYFTRLGSRAGFYRFFFLAPLCLALPFFVPLLRRFRYAWIALTVLVYALGTNFYCYFFPHYIASAACLLLLAALLGLRRLAGWRVGAEHAGAVAARAILLLCGAHFLFWYGLHATGNAPLVRSLATFETADAINSGDPQGRLAIDARLEEEPGSHLVFVRYSATHGYHEWIHNDADIDSARIVWALELTPAENEKLRRYYPDRKVWLLEPDAEPPRLVRYPATANGPFLPVE